MFGHLNEAKQNILLSRDVELNPDPTLKKFTHEQSAYSETKLLHYGLIPVGKGGQGNCFSVRVISHQLFNDPTHHLYIRAAWVNYLRQTQKGSLKAILTSHGLTLYLENMSKQGPWAHNLVIQGVADALNEFTQYHD